MASAGVPRLSASTLAYYVHLQCDVFLRRASGAPWPPAWQQQQQQQRQVEEKQLEKSDNDSKTLAKKDNVEEEETIEGRSSKSNEGSSKSSSRSDHDGGGGDSSSQGRSKSDAARETRPSSATAAVAATAALALDADGGDADAALWRQAVLDRGTAFEAELLEVVGSEDGVRVVDGAGQDPAAVLAHAVAEAAAAAHGVVLVYHWQVPADIANRLWPLPGGVAWTRLEADLLRCERDPAHGGRVRVTVVDIKASHTLKVYHQVQVALYAEFLRRLLAHWPPGPAAPATPDVALLDHHGEVWRPASAPDRFPLALFVDRLHTLLATTVPDVLAPDAAANVAWTLLARCQQCTYATDCRGRATDPTRPPSLNRLAALPAADVAWLRDACGGSIDIEDIAPRVPALVARDPARARRALALWPTGASAVLEAARTGRPVLRARLALTLPRHEDIAVLLAVVADPRTGQLVAYGAHVIVAGTGDARPTTRAAAAEAEALRALAALNVVHVFGRRRRHGDDSGGSDGGDDGATDDTTVALHLAELVRALSVPALAERTVQLYVYDTSERDRLLDAVLAAALRARTTPTINNHPDAAAAFLEASALTLVDGNAAAIQLDAPPVVDAADTDASRGDGCPRIQALATALQALFVLPSPGYCTLEDAVRHFSAAPAASDADALGRQLDRLSLGGGDGRPGPSPFAVAPRPTSTRGINDASIYAAWLAGKTETTTAAAARMMQRLVSLAALLGQVRTTAIAVADRALRWPVDRILPLVARPLRASTPIALARPALRKLAFLQTFDLAEQARQLWQDRLQRSGPLVLLTAPANGTAQGWWAVVAGAEYVGSEQDPMGNWILFALPATTTTTTTTDPGAADYESTPAVLADARFRDLLYCGQHTDRIASSLARRGLFLCDFGEVRWSAPAGASGPRTLEVNLQWPQEGKAAPTAVAPGAVFVLRPRLVDFNTGKVAECLAQLDWAAAEATAHREPQLPAFVQLLEAPLILSAAEPLVGGGPLRAVNGDPTAAASVLALYEPRELRALTGAPAALAMNPSQRHVFEWLRTHGLLVVWGPPGTGKTTFLAGALVRLLHIAYASRQPLSIYVTAFTKTAIDNLMSRVRALVAALAALPAAVHQAGLLPEDGWLLHPERDLVALNSGDPPGQAKRDLAAAGERYIVYGTCWQLHKQRKALASGSSKAAGALAAKLSAFDVVVIDEASQLGVPAAAVALQAARGQGGRIVLAGDPMQLQPILKTRFPLARDGASGARLDGSVLQSVLRHSTTGRPLDLADLLAVAVDGPAAGGPSPLPPYLFMLQTTYRCNGPLTQLAQRIYGARFESHRDAHDRRLPLLLPPPARTVAPTAAPPPAGPLHGALTALVRDEHASMVTVRVNAASTRALQLEPYGTQLAAEAHLVAEVCAWLGDHYRAPVGGTRESIFVATPHRAQRVAVRRAIEANGRGVDRADLVVDTVERLQGKEADVVIAAYLFLDPLRLGQEAGFVFNLQRLNVTFTRARMLCVLVVGEAVCDPPLDVLGAADLRPALDLIHAFVAASQTIQVGFNLDSRGALAELKVASAER